MKDMETDERNIWKTSKCGYAEIRKRLTGRKVLTNRQRVRGEGACIQIDAHALCQPKNYMCKICSYKFLVFINANIYIIHQNSQINIIICINYFFLLFTELLLDSLN